MVPVAAKHGVNGISKTFAYELATEGIRVSGGPGSYRPLNTT